MDGAAIRDRLRAVGSSPGAVVTAGLGGVAEGRRILADSGEVNYEGASGSMDWDANGDLRRGHIGVWRFTEDERIEEVRAVAFENSGGRFDVTGGPVRILVHLTAGSDFI